MKRIFALLSAFVLIIICAGFSPAVAAKKPQDELDKALGKAASDMTTDLMVAGASKGAKVAFLNVESGAAALSEYVLDELISKTVNGYVYNVVATRKQLESYQAQHGFKIFGAIEDRNAISVGRSLGAQTVVSAAVTPLGDDFRLTVRAIDVASGKVQMAKNYKMAADKLIIGFLKSAAPAPQAAPAPAPAPAPATQVVIVNQAAPAQQAQVQVKTSGTLQNGTYTFFPRLQPYRGAVKLDRNYLWKIVVRNEYMSIFMTDIPEGDASKRSPNDWGWSAAPILQDLNDAARTWSVSGGQNHGDDGYWYTFEGVNTMRFSLKSKHANSIYEEVDLSKARFEP